jgi:hypothetical protein
MKKVLIGLVALVVVGVGAIWLFVNEIVGTAIERGATYALGVETRVGFVRLALLTADFRMSGFRIANPSGFDESHFLRMRRATIDVDPGTVQQDVVVVKHFALDGIEVALEREGKQTNYGVILDNVKRFESETPPGGTPPPEAADGKRFIVNRLVITDVLAKVEWSQLAADQTGITVAIPQIELEDIGAHNAQGVAMAELSNIILKAILGSIARYGGDLPGAMLSQLNAGLGGVGRISGVVVTGIGGSAVEKVGEAVGGEVGDAIRGVGGSAAEGVGKAVGSSADKALGNLFGGGEDQAEE